MAKKKDPPTYEEAREYGRKAMVMVKQMVSSKNRMGFVIVAVMMRGLADIVESFGTMPADTAEGMGYDND